MVEVSHNGEPWRPIGGGMNVYQAPRDYAQFSVLAGVCNRAGRHEPVWQEPHMHEVPDREPVEVPGFWYDLDDGGHEPLIPIDMPRGVPDDASIPWKAFVAIWEAKGAIVDTTYLSLEEILAGLWDQPVIRNAQLTEQDYLAFVNDQVMPTTWAGQVGGPGHRSVTEAEYGEGLRGESSTSVLATWRDGTVRDSGATSTMLSLVQELESSRPEVSRLRFMLLFEG
jgi:hypothetical protein